MNYLYCKKILSKYTLHMEVAMTFSGVINPYASVTLQRGDNPLFRLSAEEVLALFDALRHESSAMEALRRMCDDRQDEIRRDREARAAKEEDRKKARAAKKADKIAAAAQLPGDSLREGAMRAARANGASYAEIGKAHGLSAQAVFQLLCPKTEPTP